MRYIHILTCLLVLSIMVSSCKDEDFLDRYPLDQVTDAVFFTNASDMELYLNQFYNRTNFPHQAVSRGDLDADTHITDKSINTRLQGTMTITASPSPSYWTSYTYVRQINYFFDNYKKCEVDFDTYKQYIGEAHFFRAMFYYTLLRNYGDVQWLNKVLQTDSPELYGTRDPRSLVADNIIADLDSAAMYMSADKTNGYTRLNKWIALLYQTRVALFEGTWQKYHAGTAFGVSNAQPEKYLNKAVEAATQVMNSGLYNIYSTGSPATDYVDLFGLQDFSSNPEVMFWNKMNLELGVTSMRKLDYLSYPNAYGITRSLVDSYLCTDGKPIAVSPLYQGNNTISDEAKNRDPRFYQTIFTPEMPWRITDGDTLFWEDVYKTHIFTNELYTTPTGYQRRKHYNPHTKYHHLNFEESPSIQFRYAEVLLNYAEAKAELGTLTQEDIDKSIKKLRDRVGMPNLEINNITSDPNWEFPALSPLINEIRRERKIELSLEELRYHDLARWAAIDEVILGKRPLGAVSSQFINSVAYPITQEGYIDPLGTALPGGWQFKTNRDYLYPILETELVLNPNLGQNPGWGTNQ